MDREIIRFWEGQLQLLQFDFLAISKRDLFNFGFYLYYT